MNTGSLLISACCALSYFYMVSSLGGYVFIINLIPIYVVVMVFVRTPLPLLSPTGRYSHRLYIAYTTFYILGSILAMQVPFVGFNVVKQAECILSHGVFIGLQCARSRPPSPVGYALLVFAYGSLPTKYYRHLLTFIFSFVVVVVILLVLIQVLG